MKADLHVHSYHSGYASHMRVLRTRDCYSSPERVYHVAKARGMDLVCLTDHDSLDGCLEFLDAHPDAPDFIIGEEISCQVPDVPRLRVHLGAVGMTERVHRDLQPLRSNVFDVAAFLRAERVFFSLNHLFLLFRDEWPAAQYVSKLVGVAPGLEVLNGAALPENNALVAVIAGDARRSGLRITDTAGSDAHTLRWIGTAYTETPATSRAQFLADLAEGRSRVGGLSGGRARLASDIYGIIVQHWASLAGLTRSDVHGLPRLVATALSVALLPLQFVPAIVATRMKANEARRVHRCSRAIAAGSPEQSALAVRSAWGSS
jgi:hypothetical protein